MSIIYQHVAIGDDLYYMRCYGKVYIRILFIQSHQSILSCYTDGFGLCYHSQTEVREIRGRGGGRDKGGREVSRRAKKQEIYEEMKM